MRFPRRALLWPLLLTAAAFLASAALLTGTAHAAPPPPTPSSTPTETPSGPAPAPSARPTGTPCPALRLVTPPLPGKTTPPNCQAPPATDSSGQPASDDGCAFIDVACKARNAVDGWFAHLVQAASKPVFQVLSSTVLATPEIDSPAMSRARQLWATSQTIANTCFVLFITAAGVMLMAGQSLPGETSPRELLPRLVWAFLAANLSLTLIGYGITFANGLSRAFLAEGGSKIDPRTVAEVIVGGLTASIGTQGVFFALIAIVVLILAVGVAFTYVVRLALTMVLIAAAPLALMFHALPLTDGLARLWWRAISGLLAIQVCQSLVLVTAFQLLFAKHAHAHANASFSVPAKTDLLDLLMLICLLFMLIRIPGWVARTVWQSNKPRMLSRLVTSLIVYRGLGMVAQKGMQSINARRPGTPRPQPPGRRPPRPGGRGPHPGGPHGGTPRRPRHPSGGGAAAGRHGHGTGHSSSNGHHAPNAASGAPGTGRTSHPGRRTGRLGHRSHGANTAAARAANVRAATGRTPPPRHRYRRPPHTTARTTVRLQPPRHRRAGRHDRRS